MQLFLKSVYVIVFLAFALFGEVLACHEGKECENPDCSQSVSRLTKKSKVTNDEAKKVDFFKNLPGPLLPEIFNYLADVKDSRVMGRLNGLSRIMFSVSPNLTALSLARFSGNITSYLKNHYQIKIVVKDAQVSDQKKYKYLRNTSLERLNLSDSSVTDRDLKWIATYFPNIIHLDISNTKISNNGLKYLKSLKKMKVLILNAKATSECLIHLTKMTQLMQLSAPKLKRATVIEWIQRHSLEKKMPFAQFRLGLHYYYDGQKGLLPEYQDKDKSSDQFAIHYFTLAADQGHSEAQYYLATMYYNRRGGTQSDQLADELAFRYYSLAAEQGDADSKHYLNLMSNANENCAPEKIP